MIRGTSQTVRFASDPEGATVRMSGQVLGKTPCDATFKKNKLGVVEFALDGYQTRFVNPSLEGQLSMEPWIWGNLGWILTGPGALVGSVGWLVDWHTGAMWKIETPFAVSLYPVGSQTPQSTSAFVTPSPSSSQVKEPSATNKSTADRLKELATLKAQGVITEEEYEQKRNAILSTL